MLSLVDRIIDGGSNPQLSHLFSLLNRDSCPFKLELNTEKEGCRSYTTPEDAQRPRAVYDIHPDFRGI